VITKYFSILLIILSSGCRESNNSFETNPVGIPEVAREEFQIILPKSGDLWLINETYEIKWSSLSKAKYVVIELYRKNTLKQIISSKTENDGSFFYTVNPDLASSNLYKIKLYNFDNPDEVATSNYFTIRQ